MHSHAVAPSRSPDSLAERSASPTRDAITIAKNPHTRFPSVNIVGRMANVRMGRMEEENEEKKYEIRNGSRIDDERKTSEAIYFLSSNF